MLYENIANKLKKCNLFKQKQTVLVIRKKRNYRSKNSKLNSIVNVQIIQESIVIMPLSLNLVQWFAVLPLRQQFITVDLYIGNRNVQCIHGYHVIIFLNVIIYCCQHDL